MRIFTAKSTAWTATMLFAAPAMAQSLDQHRANCNRLGFEAVDLQIAGCTALIESGGETDKSLSEDYYFRAGARVWQKDDPRAISDLSQVIRINPHYWLAFYARANAYARMKNYNRAISDFDEAIRIDGQYAPVFYDRGLAKRSLGRNVEGDADIARAMAMLGSNVGQ